jgi:hypothetical protein
MVTVPFTLEVNSEFGLVFAKTTEEPTVDHCPKPLASNVPLIGTGVLMHPNEGMFAKNPRQLLEHVSFVRVTVTFTGVLHTEFGVNEISKIVPICVGSHEN